MTERRKPLEATVDSVQGAIALLWDWLGGDIKKDESRAIVRDARIPPIVVDTEVEGR